MLVLRLGTWLFSSGQALAFQAELYLGLLVFVGYVLFDTQVIVPSSTPTQHSPAGSPLMGTMLLHEGQLAAEATM